MNFQFDFSNPAKESLKKLKQSNSLQKQYKSVQSALKKLQQNPRHPGLQTHQYHSVYGPDGQKVFEAYAQQHTPCAYRIFFYYGPQKGVLTIFAIEAHP